ncbi:hypothetical protein [Vibrio europaeus]|uniref:NERD domain-containing protein n=1 Tax=Vibrio europaeus TaxID=300876 RepID=A0A178J4S3_9VIBR|nr:hypothetical protein [Vibrio europaeus]MDC5706156.1 hypothetical protein [Vibrio europaeus]MDC5709566.1 hypothetical protein [Vibrio europaeus]MDC5713965.1 hypothetical protein [Vibrio europaeus]MDC5723426.1 hypothetical protein [Vibrio europaeus]MDC5730563.1 hypothetical protein [Vibrio europaeus]
MSEKNKGNRVRKIVEKIFEQRLTSIVEDVGKNIDTLQMLGEAAELMYRQGRFNEGEYIRTANEVLVPFLLENYDPSSVPHKRYKPTDFVDLFDFLRAFLSLRDFIFYSYDNEDVVTWTKEENVIKVVLNDDSILRQHASEAMSFGMNSSNAPHSREDSPELLLKGTRAFDFSNPNVKKAFDVISIIAGWKIDYYFSYIPEDSDVMLDGYKYSTFIGTYRSLLVLALYERYFSKANGLSGVITYREEELLGQAMQQYPLENRDSLAKIFRDIAKSSRCTFNYIPQENIYLLNPTCFSLVDGITNVLREFAKSDPDSFSSNVSEIMGKGLVEKIKSKIEQYPNYKVHTDLKLDKYDQKLPDIDLLAISYEPSLGFHVFVGEVKNNLPAVWGKDYLKSSGSKGFITKAISQIETIKSFLQTDDGLMLIHDLAVKAFPELDVKRLFPHGICVVVDTLIISSQSAGMFFPENNIPILDGDTLCHIIDESDGDTNYILFHLRGHKEFIDECTVRSTERVAVAEYVIEYDIIAMDKVYGLAKNEFVSVGAIEQLENESLESGYTMAGALRHLGNQDYFMDSDSMPQNMSLVIMH